MFYLQSKNQWNPKYLSAQNEQTIKEMAFTDETNQSWKSYTQGRAKREWFKMSIDVTKIEANMDSLQQQSVLYIS